MSSFKTANTKHTEQLIEGMYNYCDTWCERCLFTEKCARFLNTDIVIYDHNINEHQINDKIDLLIDNTERIIAYFKIPYPVSIGKNETIKAVINEQIFDEDKIAEEISELVSLSKKYNILMEEFLLKWKIDESGNNDVNDFEDTVTWNNDFFNNCEDEYLLEDIVDYYGPVLETKINAALYLQHAVEKQVDNFGIAVKADGYAKCALSLLAASQNCWDKIFLKVPDSVDDMISIYVLIEKMRRELLIKIPGCMEFKRPGLDL